MKRIPETKEKRGGIFHLLGRFRILHWLIGCLGIYELLNRLLSHYPVMRRLPVSGKKIRISSMASFALAEEMFINSCYKSSLQSDPVHTLVDLGCNVGWFPCLLSEIAPKSRFEGILIDADPYLGESVNWHLQKNGFDGCAFLHGAVGCPEEQKEITFHVNPSNTQSSISAFGEDHPFPVKGQVREITVPCLRIAEEWSRRFGNRPIDLMKVDVEGAEMGFLRSELPFLHRNVKKLLIEWHAWHCTLDDVVALLQPDGIILTKVLEQDSLGGVAEFRNKNMS
jgi:FkbM family methyltransferase